MKAKDLYRIGEAAHFLGVTVETLRKWERNGLITATRTLTGHRRFTSDELSRAASSTDRTVDLAAPVPEQIQMIKQQAGELDYLHYTDRLTDHEVYEYLVDSFQNPDQLSLKGDIAIVDGMLAIHAKRFGEQSTESAAAWAKARATYNRLREAQRDRDTAGVAQALTDLEKVFNAKKWIDHEAHIIQLQDHRARLVRAEVERLSKGGEFITAEEAMRMASDKLQIILLKIKELCSAEVQQEIVAALKR